MSMSNWQEFDRFARLIETAPFRFARSMKRNPHCYTLRDKWNSDRDFRWAVQYIRDNGYRGYFWGKPYIYANVNEFRYWTMGAALKDTILINRKRHLQATKYDSIARYYDGLFTDKASLAENEQVFSIVGNMAGLTVLDVGCGTGLTPEHSNPDQDKYLGIDPSSEMLKRFNVKWPRYKLLHSSLADFYSPDTYDLVLCLFGTASYISDAEVERLSGLVNYGGRIVAMTYIDGYEPVTHQKTGIDVPFAQGREKRLSDVLPGGEFHKIGSHNLYDWRKI